MELGGRSLDTEAVERLAEIVNRRRTVESDENAKAQHRSSRRAFSVKQAMMGYRLHACGKVVRNSDRGPRIMYTGDEYLPTVSIKAIEHEAL